MSNNQKNTTISSFEVILGVLTMVVIGKFTGMLPSHLLEYGLVAALPFHLLGLWLVIKSGVEPAAYMLAKRLSENNEEY